jgi:hypothetical protein
MEKISYIFGLTQVDASGCACHLDAKKVAEGTQVLDRELLLHAPDKSCKKLRMCSCHNNIINIE